MIGRGNRNTAPIPGDGSGAALALPPALTPLALEVRRTLRRMLQDPAQEPAVWSVAPALRARFAAYASATRFVAETIDGFFMWVSLRDHVESQIFWHDMQEGDRGLVRWMRAFLRPGMVVADVGAYCGFFTLLSACRVGPTGHVLAFEPQRDAYARLRRNVALNRLENVTSFPFGLSETSTEAVLLKAEPDNLGSATLHAGSLRQLDGSLAAERVRLERFDDAFATSRRNERLDLIKIDVEGHEFSVLGGAKRTLERHRPAVACEYLAGDARVLRFMRTLGYRSYWIQHDGSPTPFEGEPTRPAAQNVLFLPVARTS